jgi:hypothetical protein
VPFRGLARRVALVAAFDALAGAPGGVGAQQPGIVEITIGEAHAAMRAGQLRCRDLVQGYLDRIEAYDQRGPSLNAIQAANPRALALADSRDLVLASGAVIGPLHCVPVLLKDQIDGGEARPLRFSLPGTLGGAFPRGRTTSRGAPSILALPCVRLESEIEDVATSLVRTDADRAFVDMATSTPERLRAAAREGRVTDGPDPVVCGVLRFLGRVFGNPRFASCPLLATR